LAQELAGAVPAVVAH